jgi:hypothetical protein
MATRMLKMNGCRRAVLVGLAHHWATEARGATVAEVAAQVARNVRRVSVSESGAYRALLALERARIVSRRLGSHGSWRPTRHGALLASHYLEVAMTSVRPDVSEAVRKLAERLDAEAEHASETAQAAASLL